MENNVVELKPEQSTLAESTASANSMILNPVVMKQVDLIATMMSEGVATIPKHLQGKKADCFAIALQSAQWGMNPFAVAQKTHLINGTLGYEAQLVNAVVSSSNVIQGRFKYEYDGDWSRTNNGSTARIRAGAVLSGDDQVTWGEWIFVGDVTTKNSPLWKTAPKQQASYLAVKYWARLYCPEVIMGVYSQDELEPQAEKTINPKPDINAPIQGEVLEAVTLKSVSEIIKNAISMTELKDEELSQKMQKLSESDVATARKEWIEKKDELKAEFIKNEQEASQKKPVNSEEAIKACKNADELTALLQNISEVDQMELSDVIDDRFDDFR